MNEDQFSFGGVQSPQDYRDIPMSAVAVGTLPRRYFVDISNLPVWHQRKIGACVGHAAAKYKQKLDQLDTGSIVPLSARFLYAIAKARDGYEPEGTYPRLVAKILKDIGCATEHFVPNDTNLDHEAYVFNRDETKIPKEAFEEAKYFKIKSFAFPNVQSTDELKQAIIRGNGAILLMRIGKEWWKPSWNESDIIPLKAPKNIVSGHEVYLYGYQDVGNRTQFYILNSWSVDWGKNGTAWFWHDEYASFLNEAITFVDIPNELLKEVEQLPSKQTFKHTFTASLQLGQTGSEVRALQTALMIDGVFSRDLYAKLLKSEELGFYGSVTRNAVLSFQLKHAIPLSWYEMYVLKGSKVGPKTNTKLNQLYAN